MGIDMCPVWVVNPSSVTKSPPSLGVKVSLRLTVRPATMRPGGS